MAGSQKYWLDGLPYEEIETGLHTGAQKYWIDGLPITIISVGEEAPNESGAGHIAATSSLTGVGSSIEPVQGTGSIAGTSSVSGVGFALTGHAGAIHGTSSFTGVGASIISAAGIIHAESSVSGVGAAIAEGVGQCAGSSRVIGHTHVILGSTSVVTAQYTYLPIGLSLSAFNPRRNPNVTIQGTLGNAPNSLRYTEGVVEPDCGQHVIADFGNGPLFQGPIQVVAGSYKELPQNMEWSVVATDYVWFLNRRRPFGRWTDVSATLVVLALMEQFASSEFTTEHVQEGLPNVTVRFGGGQTFASCLSTIANLIDGDWYLDIKDLHFFIEEEEDNPDDITDDHPTLELESVVVTKDATQIRTRVFVKGTGTTVSRDHSPGATELEVESNEMFMDSGGLAIVADSQVIRYSGRREAMIADPLPEESLPEVGPGHAMTITTSATNIPGHYRYISELHAFCTSFLYSDGSESDYSPMSNIWIDKPLAPFITINGTVYGSVYLPHFANIPIGSPVGDTICIGRKIWMFDPSVPDRLILWAIIFDNVLTQSTIPRGFGGANVAKTRTMAPAPVGPTGTVTAIMSDHTAESVGLATVPASEATGSYDFQFSVVYDDGTESTVGTLTPPVNLTDSVKLFHFDRLPTVREINGVSPKYFKVYQRTSAGTQFYVGPIPVGGWPSGLGLTSFLLPSKGINRAVSSPRLSDLAPTPVIRPHYYLTGIPESGDGSILYPIFTDQILNDSSVRIFVQVDDEEAQAELAVSESGDGVHEHTLEGEYRNEAEARIAGEADLILFSRPIYTVNYACRDRKSRSGKTVVINLTYPEINKTLKIQDVTIDQIHETGEDMDDPGELVERYNVTASTVRFTFDDLVRRMQLTEE